MQRRPVTPAPGPNSLPASHWRYATWIHSKSPSPHRLKTICEAAGGVLGEAWLPVTPGATNVRLTRGGVWAHPDRRLESFVAQGAGFEFAPGEGLPGMAWERRQVIWANPLSTARISRARHSPGWRVSNLAALAIPILVDGEPIARPQLLILRGDESPGHAPTARRPDGFDGVRSTPRTEARR